MARDGGVREQVFSQGEARRPDRFDPGPEWKDKEGNDRKTVEVVADSVEFADGKDQGAGSYAADQMAAAADQQFTEVEDDDGELPF